MLAHLPPAAPFHPKKVLAHPQKYAAKSSLPNFSLLLRRRLLGLSHLSGVVYLLPPLINLVLARKDTSSGTVCVLETITALVSPKSLAAPGLLQLIKVAPLRPAVNEDLFLRRSSSIAWKSPSTSPGGTGVPTSPPTPKLELLPSAVGWAES